MTKNIEAEKPDLQSGLLTCCRHLAKLAGQEDFASELAALTEAPGSRSRKETLENVMRVSRAAGLSPEILRLAPDQFGALAGLLPAVAELRDGGYVILAGIGGSAGEEPTVTLLVPQPDGHVQQEKISCAAFLPLAAGGCSASPGSTPRWSASPSLPGSIRSN